MPRVHRWVARCVALALVPLASSQAFAASAGKAATHVQSVADLRLGEDAQTIAAWAVSDHDTHGLPFLIVDKRKAMVAAFDPAGRFLGSAPVLLGLARGDDSVPGIGERKIADIRPHERTTPAGRFAAELGFNTHGEDILWVDYDNAVSMHRVRPVKASDRRLQRLASPTAADNRISYGCINIPPAFFDGVVTPLFLPRNGIVYVLPEIKPLAAVVGSAVTRTARR
jgi:hypothetical protein